MQKLLNRLPFSFENRKTLLFRFEIPKAGSPEAQQIAQKRKKAKEKKHATKKIRTECATLLRRASEQAKNGEIPNLRDIQACLDETKHILGQNPKDHAILDSDRPPSKEKRKSDPQGPTAAEKEEFQALIEQLDALSIRFEGAPIPPFPDNKYDAAKYLDAIWRRSHRDILPDIINNPKSKFLIALEAVEAAGISIHRTLPKVQGSVGRSIERSIDVFPQELTNSHSLEEKYEEVRQKMEAATRLGMRTSTYLTQLHAKCEAAVRDSLKKANYRLDSLRYYQALNLSIEDAAVTIKFLRKRGAPTTELENELQNTYNQGFQITLNELKKSLEAPIKTPDMQGYNERVYIRRTIEGAKKVLDLGGVLGVNTGPNTKEVQQALEHFVTKYGNMIEGTDFPIYITQQIYFGIQLMKKLGYGMQTLSSTDFYSKLSQTARQWIDSPRWAGNRRNIATLFFIAEEIGAPLPEELKTAFEEKTQSSIAEAAVDLPEAE